MKNNKQVSTQCRSKSRNRAKVYRCKGSGNRDMMQATAGVDVAWKNTVANAGFSVTSPDRSLFFNGIAEVQSF